MVQQGKRISLLLQTENRTANQPTLIFLFLSLYLTFPLFITSSFNRMTLA